MTTTHPLLDQITARPDVQRALAALDVQRTLEQAIAIQQIAAPTFAEAARAEWVAARFAALGLHDIETDSIYNVYARYPGSGAAAPLLVSAHTDTVFPAETDLTLHRRDGNIYGPGIGDNSLSVATLLALVRALQAGEITPPGDLWLVANTGEEGLGNLGGMKAVIERLGGQIGAAIVLEGLSYGQLCHHGIGIRRYRITVRCQGGHPWASESKPSAIHHLLALGTKLAKIKLPRQPRTTLNIGLVAGGTSVNTVAAQASIDIDLRSETEPALAALDVQVRRRVASARHPGVTVEIEAIGHRPSGKIASEHPLAQLATAAIYYSGDLQPQTESGSTDANIPLSLGIPAVCIGLTHGGGTHTVDEYIDPTYLPNGLRQLLLLTLGAFHLG